MLGCIRRMMILTVILMIGPWVRTILVVPAVKRANLLGSRIMFSLPHRPQLLGGPR
jgi:hypothetical protein